MSVIEDMNYQAGMFEGEGSIRINKPTKRNMGSLLVDLANTVQSIPLEFQKMWGGSIKYHPPQGRRKGYWRWRAASKMAEAFLLAMWPCLRTSKYKARCVLALDFQSQKATYGRWVGSDYLDRQWRFYERMKELNHRGHDPLPPHERNRP